MQAFANKFTIFFNQDKTEAIINFYQEIPDLSNVTGQVVGNFPTEVTPVANLAMTSQCAKNLLDSLQALLNKE